MTEPIDTAKLEGAILHSSSSRERGEGSDSTSSARGEEKNGETTLNGHEEDTGDKKSLREDLEMGEALNESVEVKTRHRW